jgi:hypothetical protein
MSEVKTNKISSLASNNDITIDPDGTGDVVVASGHKLGVGTTSPTYQATVFGSSQSTVEIESGSDTGESRLYFTDPTTTGVGEIGYYHNGNSMRFGVNGSERMRIDSSGRVGIGATSSNQTLHVQGNGLRLVNSSDTDALHLFAYDDNNAATFLYNASGANTIQFHSGGNSFFNPSTSNTGLLIGKSSSNSGNAGVELKNDGFFAVTRDGGRPVLFRRNSDDGQIVQFNQDATEEGGISVSGSTVSYNGGHLARWSRLADNSKDTGIVKGTVLTNLDQMVVWSHAAVAATYYTADDELPDGVSVGDEKTPAVAAYTEDNEQLNCMAVSSVEGDSNVAGVFVNWDDRDAFNDMNIAMTGDMVIRIASDTTVARGDLLMSAGDGTAKPQDDDIVRSKTIAKVTSTTKSHTYDDGSYLVPCVLMAC